jgi:hypothetical protein
VEVRSRYYSSFYPVVLLICAGHLIFFSYLLQSSKLIKNIGDMMHIQVIIEGSMNSSNPYFNSSWRRNFVVRKHVIYIFFIRNVLRLLFATVSPTLKIPS